MGNTGMSDWQRRYDRSIKEETSRIEEMNKNESAGWGLLDGLPSTGTGLDLLFIPAAVGIVGVSAVKWLRRRGGLGQSASG